MDQSSLFSISADIFCLLLCAVTVIAVWLWRPALGRTSSHILSLFLIHAIQLLANLLGLVLRGGTAPWVHSALVITNFTEFAAGYVLSYAMSLYVIACLERDGDLDRWKRVSAALFSVSFALLVISQFTGLFYTIGADNVYRRSTLHPLAFAMPMLLILMIGVILLRYRSRMIRKERLAIGIYLILPAIGIVTQPFVYGIYFILLADTISMTIMFLIMLFVQTRRCYENAMELERRNAELTQRELELQEARISLMISQVQPHFLYNVLNSIYFLCDEDPKAAQKALSMFAAYLRGNLDALTRKDTVPFSMELEQVRYYLKLEQVRFGELLTVEFDIQANGFSLPCMTVQPLVENAVRHGLGKAPHGGKVTIASREIEGVFTVTISDDGIGFDPEAPSQDGKNHVGIENVRSRLQAISQGNLEISSAPGCGTIAVITVPKGED